MRLGVRVRVCLALGCGALGWGSVAALGQQQPERTISRTPTEGPPGTVIELSGTGCLLYGRATERVGIFMYSREFDTSTTFPVASDGTWSGSLAVPAQAPPGNYRIRASCIEQDQVLPGVETDFRVLQGSTTTTTTTASTTTTTAASTTSAPVTSSNNVPQLSSVSTTPTTLPPTPRAVAVLGEPRFTG